MNAPTPIPVLRWIAASADADSTIPLPRAWQPVDFGQPAVMTSIPPAPLLLQQRYRDSLPIKHAELTSRWHSLHQQPTNRDAQQALQEALHRLAGSAGAYGYPEMGELARTADALMIHQLGLWDGKLDREMPMPELDTALGRLLQSLQAAF